MTRKNVIVRNTLSTIVMQIASAGLPFVLLPYLLSYWGSDEYGILVLAYSVHTFVYFLNAAIQLTFTKYVSEFNELGDGHRLNVAINNLWLVSFLNNLCAGLITCLVGLFALDWFNLSGAVAESARRAFLVLGICTIPLGCFIFLDGVMSGLQRIHQNNLFRLIEALGNAVAAIAVIHFQQSLWVYMFLLNAIPMVVRSAQFRFLKRILPHFKLAPFEHFDMKELRYFSRFSAFQIINQLADIMLYNAQKLIIQKMLGLSWLTMYEISSKPNHLFQRFISMPLSAILPACSAAYAREDKLFLEKMLVIGTRIYLILVLPSVLAATMLIGNFIHLWLGDAYLAAVPAAQLFLCAFLLSCPFKVFSHMMVGKARVFEYGVARLAYAILGVPISIILIREFGIIGGVAVTFAYWFLVNIPIQLYVMRKEHISWALFTKTIAPIALVIVLEYFLLSILIGLRLTDTWTGLINVGAISVSVTMIGAYCFVLKKDERSLIRLSIMPR
jgi:O-antigen/teichoic acid export membrane protein